jgi:hypothetical protein
MDVMSELAEFLGDHAVAIMVKFRDIPAGPVRGWKERNLVVPVTGNSLSDVHELVADTGRTVMGRSPDRIWLIAGCGVRAKQREDGHLHIRLGVATLLALPPEETRAVVARALKLSSMENPRTWLRTPETLELAQQRQRAADDKMATVVSGQVAAAALLHQAVVADGFARYLAECVVPLRGGDVLPSGLYAGWRERYHDETERAWYAADVDLDQVDPWSRAAEYPPLGERLGRLTDGIDRLDPFPDAPPTAHGLPSTMDHKLSRATLRRPVTGRCLRVPWSEVGDEPYRRAAAARAAAVHAAAARATGRDTASVHDVLDLYEVGQGAETAGTPAEALVAVLVAALREGGYACVSPVFPHRLRGVDGVVLDVPTVVRQAIGSGDYAAVRALVDAAGVAGLSRNDGRPGARRRWADRRG